MVPGPGRRAQALPPTPVRSQGWRSKAASSGLGAGATFDSLLADREAWNEPRNVAPLGHVDANRSVGELLRVDLLELLTQRIRPAANARIVFRRVRGRAPHGFDADQVFMKRRRPSGE